MFHFDAASPGSAFFLPKGAHVYNKLIELMRREYRVRGFKEVVTPNLYKESLYKTSGHWDHYRENMFMWQSTDEGEDGDLEHYAIKPMNCPGHCVVFGASSPSYKDMPLRIADFSVLHRNEASGALTGLTRVRKFTQDDAHIFCRKDQIGEEMENCLEFLKYIYDKFGFNIELALSTRPEKCIGDEEMWESSEKSSILFM